VDLASVVGWMATRRDLMECHHRVTLDQLSQSTRASPKRALQAIGRTFISWRLQIRQQALELHCRKRCSSPTLRSAGTWHSRLGRLPWAHLPHSRHRRVERSHHRLDYDWENPFQIETP